MSLNAFGSSPRHPVFTVQSWIRAVEEDDTDLGYAAYVVRSCLDHLEDPPDIFVERSRDEEEQVIRESRDNPTYGWEGRLLRENWVRQVKSEMTYFGFDLWQINEARALAELY